MWIPSIAKVTKSNGRVTVLVSFDNDTSQSLGFTREYSVTNLVNLKTLIRNEIQSITDLYAFADALPEGSIDPALPTPTQSEIDKAEWFTNYQRWTSVKKAIDAGILTGNEPKVVALKDLLATKFKQTYIDSL